MKEWKQESQCHSFMKSTCHPDPEKIKRPLQSEKFSRNILPLAFDHIKLLDLGNSAKQIPGSIDSPGISGDDLRVGIVCFFFLTPFPRHIRARPAAENDLLAIYLFFSVGVTLLEYYADQIVLIVIYYGYR